MAVTKKYSGDLKASDTCILDFPPNTYGFAPGIELLSFHSLLRDLLGGFSQLFLKSMSAFPPPICQIKCQIPLQPSYCCKI